MFKNKMIGATIGISIAVLSASAIAECATPTVELSLISPPYIHSSVTAMVEVIGNKCLQGKELTGYFIYKDEQKRTIDTNSINRPYYYDGDTKGAHDLDSIDVNALGVYSVTFNLNDNKGKQVASDTLEYTVAPIDLPYMVANNPSPSFESGTELHLLSSKINTNCKLVNFNGQKLDEYDCYFEATKDGSKLLSWVKGDNVFVKIPPGIEGSSYSFDWVVSKYAFENRNDKLDKAKEVLSTGVQRVEYVKMSGKLLSKTKQSH